MASQPKLLSGGNPQIPKGYGEEPVKAYLDAMPGWKQDVGRKLDALITRAVPMVRKAVKWNTPLYGAADEEQGWFASFHCFTRYIKLTLYAGGELDPPPPETSKYPRIRHLHIHENENIDEKQLTRWMKAAAKLPGENM